MQESEQAGEKRSHAIKKQDYLFIWEVATKPAGDIEIEKPSFQDQLAASGDNGLRRKRTDRVLDKTP